MKKACTRSIVVLLLVCMMINGSYALAQEENQKTLIFPGQEIWPVLPVLTENGFLAQDAQPAEFIHVDQENGLWLYISKDLHIEILRYQDTESPLIWYEADIRTTGEETLHTVLADPKRPGRKFLNNQLVFAINDDQFGERRLDKVTVGIVVRNGEIITSKTMKNGNKGFPNLDTMALFPDGTFKVFQSKEYAAEEYLSMGATDVLCFGPFLIRDGVTNPALNERYDDLQPRCAIGLVEPYHYKVVLVEGRHEGTKGVGLLWIAQRLEKLGAKEAFNLDGGNTSAMVFMGEKLNTNNSKGPDNNVRSLTGMLGIGTSQHVPKE